MDHAIDALRPYLEVEIDCMRSEWKSGSHAKFSDCPSYSAVKTLIDAMNVLRKYLGWDNLKLKELIEFGY
jgi:hypothetical protein